MRRKRRWRKKKKKRNGRRRVVENVCQFDARLVERVGKYEVGS